MDVDSSWNNGPVETKTRYVSAEGFQNGVLQRCKLYVVLPHIFVEKYHSPTNIVNKLKWRVGMFIHDRVVIDCWAQPESTSAMVHMKADSYSLSE